MDVAGRTDLTPPADQPRAPRRRPATARCGVAFQRTKTWKESPDPEREAKLDRIEEVLDRFPDRVFAFDELGPLGIRPTAGSGWARQKHPDRMPATFRRTHGVRYLHGCYSITASQQRSLIQPGGRLSGRITRVSAMRATTFI
ncbi:hypothetical protein GA0070558_13011 [Micromonospora haikouensis]|uniref:Transposase n=1 Tax=Micromonospora haikouensis TaxID=686309 RepID=A0A1C4XUG6_9ACTN|nr:hypothetical protein GA0070558_13011 [Micromonospora haikouensis]